MDGIVTITAKVFLFPVDSGGRRTPAATSGIYCPGIDIEGHGIWTCTLQGSGDTAERSEFPFDEWCDALVMLRASTYQNMNASSQEEFPIKEGSRTVGTIKLLSSEEQRSQEN